MKLSDQFSLINRFRESVPVDVESLAEALGVDVQYAFLAPEVSGMVERNNGRHLITVNAYDPDTRQRFTIAHELGHYMLHRHLIGDGVDDDRAYRSTEVGKYHNTRIGPKEETEANRFAANVLMPLESIRSQDSKDPAELARLFRVSEQAMCIRLGIPCTPRML